TKGQKGKKEGGSQNLKDDVLKAIVLADSFTKEFRPITFEKPRCLLPLVNIPIIEYILELLAASGVEEIYIFCCSNAAVIRNYIENSKWVLANSGVVVNILESNTATSAGDALRVVFSNYIIHTDFVLIQGDVVSNIDLKPIIQQHKLERAKADSQLLMTSVFRTKRIDEREHTVWLALSQEQNQIVLYENDKRNTPLFDVALDKFDHFADLQLRSDLVDCQIDICSPDVLEIFNENFDFEDMRRAFLKNYVLEEEVFTYKVAPYIVSGAYSSRVSSLRTYEMISRDIVHRWMHPIVPDANFTRTTNFKFSRPNNYYEDKVTLSRTCEILIDTVIGKHSCVGEQSVISKCIIGRNVKIGAHVKMNNSFVWDNVTIHDGVTLDHCIVCDGAVIGANAVLKRGSVISFGVHVDQNITLEEHTRWTTFVGSDQDSHSESSNIHIAFGDDDDDDDDDDDAFSSDSDTDISTPITPVTQPPPQQQQDQHLHHHHHHHHHHEKQLGPNGKGVQFKIPPYLLNDRLNFLGVQESDFIAEQEYEDEEEEEQATSIKKDLIEREQQHVHGDQKGMDFKKFVKEAQETIRRAVLSNHTIDNTKLEMNSLKYAYNTSYSDCAKAMLCDLMLQVDDGRRSSADMIGAFDRLLRGDGKSKTGWSELLIHFIRDEMDEIDLLDSLLDFCKNEGKKFGPLFKFFVKKLYDLEILQEESIIKWYYGVVDGGDSSEYAANDVKLAQQCTEIIKWFETAEEESGSESESESGSESD
ncbi:eif2b5, partial [Acrasis kona]